MSRRSRSLLALLFVLSLAVPSYAGTREPGWGRNRIVKKIVQVIRFVLVPLEDTIGGPRP